MIEYFKSLDFSKLAQVVEKLSNQSDYPQWVIILLLVLLAYSIVALIVMFIVVHTTKEAHVDNVLASYEVITVIKNKLKKKDYQGAFYHLRFKVDPYVFEECLMTAFEKDTRCKVHRSQAYSGDGGIDGKVTYKGKTWLIQAKRYKSYINPKHVQSHIELCGHERKKGLFIHTGKSGDKSSKAVRVQGNVGMVSGRALLNLLAGIDKPSLLLERIGRSA